MLTNSCNIVNPLFRFLHIKNEPKKGYTQYKLGTTKDGADIVLLIDYVPPESFKDESLNTIGGAIAEGTKYGDYITGNKFTNATDKFIAKKPSTATYRYGFKFNDYVFACWYDDSSFIYFINDKVPADKQVIALTIDDYDLNMIALENSREFIRTLKRLYLNGVVRFESPVLRENYFKMCKLLNLR